MAEKGKKYRWEFFRYMIQKDQLAELTVFLLVFLWLFSLIKFAYPFPDTFPDSGDYIACALTKEINCYRPIGYSWFLSWFNLLSDRIQAVSSFQFLINTCASLYFIFTIKFFIPPRKPWLFRLFSLLVILSPTTLYLTNTLMSDSIFISLTLMWFASALWLNYRMRVSVLLLHLMVLYLLIQVRYTALIYPLFSSMILFIRWKKRGRVLGIAPLLVLTLVVFQTRKEYLESFRVPTFTPFSGWQLANNAIHMVPHIELDPSEFKDDFLSVVHTKVLEQHPEVYPENSIGSSFMWDNNLALKTICREFKRVERTERYGTIWMSLGKDYGKYGRILILKYPLKYFRHFVWHNIKLAAYPQPELLGSYRSHKPGPPLTSFYTVRNQEFTPRWDYFNRLIKPVLAPGSLIIWIMMLAMLVFWSVKRRNFSFSGYGRGITFLLISFLIVYIGFHLVTTPIALRYLSVIAFAKLGIGYVFMNNYSTAYTVR